MSRRVALVRGGAQVAVPKGDPETGLIRGAVRDALGLLADEGSRFHGTGERG